MQHLTSGFRWPLPLQTQYLEWKGALSWPALAHAPELCRGPPQGEGIPAERLGARIKGYTSTSQAHSLSHLSSFLKLADLHRHIPSKRREPQSAVGLKPLSFWNLFVFYIASISELLFNGSAVSDSLQPQGLQHARLPCPSPAPGVCSN